MGYVNINLFRYGFQNDYSGKQLTKE